MCSPLAVCRRGTVGSVLPPPPPQPQDLATSSRSWLALSSVIARPPPVGRARERQGRKVKIPALKSRGDARAFYSLFTVLQYAATHHE